MRWGAATLESGQSKLENCGVNFRLCVPLRWRDVTMLILHLGKEKRALKTMCSGNGQTSLRLKLKIESEAAQAAGGCLWYVTWGFRFSVYLLMVLFTLL